MFMVCWRQYDNQLYLFRNAFILIAIYLNCLCYTAQAGQKKFERGHLEYEFYQDYKVNNDQALNGYLFHKSVKLLELKTLRFDFQKLASELDSEPKQQCVVGDSGRGRCKAFQAYNPSIIGASGGGFWVLGRASNWSLCKWNGEGRPYSDYPNTKYPDAIFEEYHSHILVQRVSAGLEPQGPPRHVRVHPQIWDRTRAPFFEIFRQGLEDPRLVDLPSGLFALVSYASPKGRKQPTRLAPSGTGVSAFRQALLAFGTEAALESDITIPAESFVPMVAGFNADEQQKNWMPFTYRGVLFAIHQLVPVQQILQLNATSGATFLDYENPVPAALEELHRKVSIRGGTQAIAIPEKNIYLAIAHISRGRTQYTHFFVAFEDTPPFKIIAVSREWCIAHKEDLGSGPEPICEGIQFISGLAVDGSRLLLTYGVQDCDARMAIIPTFSALKSLKYFSGKEEL